MRKFRPAMISPAKVALVGLTALACVTIRTVSADVLHYRYDMANSGQNDNETVLTPANVNSRSFGRLATLPVDGQIFAQPLVKTGVRITAGSRPGVHDAVFVATEHDSVYALDANSGEELWRRSFLDIPHLVTSVPAPEIQGDHNIWPEMGITGTPVIDAASASLFVSVLTRELIDGEVHYIQRLHVLRLGDGSDRAAPAVMGDTIRDTKSRNGYIYVSGASVAGNGDGSVDGRVTFNAMRENQRPALTLVQGVVYIAFASHNDIGPYHGWILGYKAADLKPAAVFCATPTGGQGGIWMGGAGPTVDIGGNLYVSTGNGSFTPILDDRGFPLDGNYGNAFLKLAPDPTTNAERPAINGWGLKVVDYFIPTDYAQLNHDDNDIGGGGLTLLPDAAGGAAHRHLLAGGGKDRRVIVVDRDAMGKFHADGDRTLQELTGTVARIFSAPSFLNGKLLTAMDGDSLLAMPTAEGHVAQPTLRSANHFGFPGANIIVTSDHGKNIVLWLLDRGANSLCAYSETNFDKPLYFSKDIPEDSIGNVVRFTVPVVDRGRVYVGTNSSLVIYGPRGETKPATTAEPSPGGGPAPATPVDASAKFNNGAIDLKWANRANNATSYRILRKTGGDGVFEPIADLPADATSYTDTKDVKPRTYYDYHILALNQAGNADFAGVVMITP